ncbi:MAG: adenylyl-sulfate kinase, partial [Candidatus Poribacteria bacterium]|nr:adenylyl-sulfate kinase [Candidatus Poribacteria bacterium]
YRVDRDKVRNLLEDGGFIEVYVDCPIEECEKRDPKGLYKKARSGEIKGFTGIDAPYEAPEKPEITVDTSMLNLEDSARKVIGYLESADLI